MSTAGAAKGSEGEDLYQIALLIDQLKHDDVTIRINASNSLIRIATALGPQRTREELVPFLCESTDDEDDVLRTIAERLGEMVACVGGEAHVRILLEPLELLATVEDSSVRNAAVKSIATIVAAMPEEHIEQYYVPFVVRLATKDWFTSRISATSLFHVGYTRLAEKDKQKFRSIFTRLCFDDTPLVRRFAAQNYGSFARLLTRAELTPEFLSAFERLSRDEQDAVRIQSITSATAVASSLSSEGNIAYVIPFILACSTDKGWRVRWALASHLHELCASLGAQINSNTLAGIYETLLTDGEAEVRAAASSCASLVCSHLSKDQILRRLFPVLQRLVTDSSEHVRASLANVVNDLAITLGKQDTVEHLLPLLLLFLRDETSEVRLNIISNLDKINTVIGVELLSQALLPAIVDLAEDTNWRVRTAIIDHMPMLAQRLGAEFFGEKLNGLCMAWLGDSVYSVRFAAAEILPRLAVLFGDEWARDQILPQLERMHVHTNYLHRMTALYGVQHLVASSVSVDLVEGSLVPLVIGMATDAVPNVRFTVAKTLQAVRVGESGSALSSSTVQLVNSALWKLNEDADRDVRFYAKKALN